MWVFSVGVIVGVSAGVSFGGSIVSVRISGREHAEG